jgi:hypothetical protein
MLAPVPSRVGDHLALRAVVGSQEGGFRSDPGAHHVVQYLSREVAELQKMGGRCAAKMAERLQKGFKVMMQVQG